MQEKINMDCIELQVCNDDQSLYVAVIMLKGSRVWAFSIAFANLVPVCIWAGTD